MGRDALAYRRADGLVFRWMRGSVLVGGPDRATQRLEGMAALVWMALDSPAAGPDVERRLHTWSDLAGSAAVKESTARVSDVLELLVKADLVIVDSSPPEAEMAPKLSRSSSDDLEASGPSCRGHISVPALAAEEPGRIGSGPDSLGASAPTIERALAGLVGWLLPGAPPLCGLTDPADLASLVGAADTQGVLGHLLVAVDGGAMELSPELVDLAATRHEASLIWCMKVEDRLLEVNSWFADIGDIGHLVVKGPAVAHLDAQAPALRPFADLDVLVPGPEFDQALGVLFDHGGTRDYAERRPGFDRRFGKSVTVTLPDKVQVDVHRTLCDGTHGFRIPLGRLFDEATTFPLSGVEVSTLSHRHRALHAAYHGVLGSLVPPLRTLRDLAGYLTHPDLTPEVLAAEARVWRGEAVLAEAVAATFDVLDFDAPAWQRWLDGVEIDPAEARIVAEQRVESGSFGLAKVAALRELAPRDRLAYAVAVAVPSSAHLQSRGVGRFAVLRTAAARLGGPRWRESARLDA